MMGTNYILCSVGSKPNQNKNEQTTPHPNPKKAARRNAGSSTEYTDSKGTVWHSWLGCAFNSATYLWLHLVFMTRQGPRNSQATKYSPPQYNFPFLHFLSRIRVFFLQERSAVHDGWESLILGARTLISRPLKPLGVQNTVWRQAWRQPWRGCVQTEGGGGQTTPSSSFLKQEEKPRDGMTSEGCPVRRWWRGTTVAESGCQHLLTASLWVFSGPCTCPHRDERWPERKKDSASQGLHQHPREPFSQGLWKAACLLCWLNRPCCPAQLQLFENWVVVVCVSSWSWKQKGGNAQFYCKGQLQWRCISERQP